MCNGRFNIMALVLAVAAFMVAGCQNEVLVDCQPQGGEQQEQVIMFDNGMVDNPVGTRALYALSMYQGTMGVWGWRSDATMTDERLFIDHLISYNNTIEDWTYSPLKYWEQHSTYRFNAYSPHSSDARAAGASVSVNEENGYISIEGVALQGDNIRMSDAGHNLKNTFAQSSDVDWMVARQGQTALGRQRQQVQFVMNHILAKMNVRVRASSVLAGDAGIESITLNSLSVGSFLAKGDFEQKLTHVPSALSATDMSAVEWSTAAADTAYVTLNSAQDVELDADYTYVLESLVLPQNMREYDSLQGPQTIRMRYSFTFADGRTEYYDFMTNLENAFGGGSASGADGRFMSGYSYTLSININPDLITYSAGVDSWTDADEAYKTIN